MKLVIYLLFCIIGPDDVCLPLVDWLTLLEKVPSIYNPLVAPPIEEMPILAFNYWPYEWIGGQWVMMNNWRGQCDSDCSYFSNGIHTRLEWMNQSAACITGWTGRYPHNTNVVTLPGFGDYVCNDSFGDPDYRTPRFQEEFGMWVIPLDRFSPDPTMELVWDWSLSSILVSQEPPQ